MSDNVPRSVLIAISAAMRDVSSAINGASYKPVGFDGTAVKHLENFMLGIVASHYPKTKASWVDSSMDAKWVAAGLDEELVDGAKLNSAFSKVWQNLSESDQKLLQGMNFSKFNKQPITKLKENQELYNAYMGTEGAPGLGMDIEHKENFGDDSVKGTSSTLAADLVKSLSGGEPAKSSSGPTGATGSRASKKTIKRDDPESVEAVREPGDVSGPTVEEKRFSGNAAESPEIIPNV